MTRSLTEFALKRSKRTVRHCLRSRLIVPSVMIVALLGALGMPGRAAGESATAQQHTLANGLRVVIVRDPIAPVASIRVVYHVGFADDPGGFSGLSHAEEHMLFRSCRGLSTDQLSDVIAQLGGRFSATTEAEATTYSENVPAEDLGIALHVEAIRMHYALNLGADWSVERRTLVQEAALAQSDPKYRIMSVMQQQLIRGAQIVPDASGTPDTVSKISAADLQKFYSSWYAPNNAVLIVTGDVDSSVALATITRLFESIPRRTIPRHALATFVSQPAGNPQRQIEIQGGEPYPIVLAAYQLPGYASADWAATRIMRRVLQADRPSLMGTLDETAIGTQFSIGSDLSNLDLAFAVAVPAQDVETQVLATSLTTFFAKLAHDGVPSSYVEAARQEALSALDQAPDSIPGLADRLAYTTALFGRLPADERSALSGLTKSDVDAVAAASLSRPALIVIVKPGSGAAATAPSPADASETFTTAMPQPVTLPVWAQSLASELSVPQRPIAPTETTLGNGLRLIVEPIAQSVTVSVVGFVRNEPGLEEPTGEEGITQLLNGALRFGSAYQAGAGFTTALDRLGGAENAGMDFSLTIPVANLDAGVDLLADNLLHPVFENPMFDDATFAQGRGVIAQQAVASANSPTIQAQRALLRALYPSSDPTLREANAQTIDRVSLADLKAYYAKVFRPDLTTIVVAGNVTTAAARAAIDRAFGMWSVAGPPPATALGPVPLNAPNTIMVPERGREHDLVTLSQLIPVSATSDDAYALKIDGLVLGGEMPTSRFFQNLRYGSGIVYSIESTLTLGTNRSQFTITYDVDPGHRAAARAMIQQQVKALQTQAAPAWEIRRAKAALIHGIPLDESSVSDIAESLLQDARQGLPLDNLRASVGRYLAVTPEQARAAFARWIRPDGFVEVVRGPGSP